jgi:hypothetical protein
LNERIRELSKQAFEYTLDRLNSGLEFRDFQPIWSEKFAELIVQDVFGCIADERFEIYEPVIQKVKQHFGVE